MINNKKILAVVPARGGSKGVKLKNIRRIGDTSLVAKVGEIVQQINIIDKAIVSTDHHEIAKIAMKSGLEVPFFRPEELSGDRIGDVDVLTHALLEMEKINNTKYDIIVMLQPTSPDRTVKHITDAISKFIKTKAESVWTVSETDSKGHPYKQLVIEDDTIDFFDKRGREIIARQELTATYHKNGIAYVISRDCLINKKSIEGDKCIPFLVDGYVSNIDTELDIAFAEFLLTYHKDVK
jgi:CMP-N,N'-diacetyllegionaminic acid synthase